MAREIEQIEGAIPTGYCQCGCGEKTSIPKHDHSRDGVKAGVPRRFLKGHGRHGRRPPLYERADRGFRTPCWICNRAKRRGYARMSVNGRPNVAVHRYLYERANGPVPVGLELDHLCRQRDCVNPEHLQPVTTAVNSRRGRQAKLGWHGAFAVRAARRSTTLTRLEIAEMVGVSKATIDAVLSGRFWSQP